MKSIKGKVSSIKSVMSQSTIARNLAVTLIKWTSIAMAVLALLFMSYEILSDRLQVKNQTSRTAIQIAQILSQAVWTFNETEIKSTVNSYLLSPNIVSIKVTDDEKKTLFASEKDGGSKDVKSVAMIKYRGKNLGRVEVISTTTGIMRKSLNTFLILLVALLLALAIAVNTITKMLQIELETPLNRLGNAIRRIAVGNYHEKILPSPQIEINRIGEEVNFMADKISLREHQIRQNIQEQTILKAELGIAETLQRSMVATRGSTTSRRIAQFYRPMQNLSGDWMTVIECNGGRIIYAIVGDVTGHGIPQGLVTMVAFGAIQTLRPLIQQNHDSFTPSTIMNILRSTMISLLNECNLAMTVAILKIDLDQRDMRICNAGHPFPLILSEDNGKMNLKPMTSKPQPPFGYELLTRTVAQQAYKDIKVDLSEKEMICLFSDGLTEAKNRLNKPFQKPFLQLLRQVNRLEPVNHVMEKINSSLSAHIKDAVVEDDICLMLIDTRLELENEKVA
ncbi:MAG: SpoIIE family protein phosphatase [Proteobacteria bacterium]|nr:SpoIIE family protein phosphatase [Pseudomonadota bacterium]